MDDLRFYVLFNSILVIAGLWVGDNERLCTIQPSLQLKKSLSQVGLEVRGPGSSVGKVLASTLPTELPGLLSAS